LAMHYRRAPEPDRAREVLQTLLARHAGPHLHVFGGKAVLNAISAAAPDKAHAMRDLVARAGTSAALFIGDDVNDEPVFQAAPAGWVTVRLGGSGAKSRARFSVPEQGDMVSVLDALLGAASRPGP